MEHLQDSSGSEEDKHSMLNSKLFVVLRKTKHEETIINGLETCLLGGADINTQNRRGNTILHLASKKRYQQVVRYLLSIPGIRPDIENKDGCTAETLAMLGSLEYSSLDISNQSIGNTDVHINIDQGEYGTNVDEDFQQPLSTNLTVDKDLHISNKTFAELLFVCNYSSRPRGESLNLEPFPANKIMALFAILVYSETGKKNDAEYEKSLKLPKGWTLLTTASNTSKWNGYFGAAFLNPSLQQVVVAHRGTVPRNSGSWWTNFVGIIWNKNTPRMNSAVTFTTIICKALSEATKTNYRRFQLSLTGHSLGGWLAQVSAFSAKHVKKDGERFIKLKNEKEGFLAHTVVFDNPGCKEMMRKLRDSPEFRYDSSIVLERLDITCYLSAPNRINGCNLHLGALFRVITDLSDMRYYHRKTPLYNLATHDMQKMLNAFEGTPTIEQVLNWSRSGALRQGPEHDEFFLRANHGNNYNPQTKEGEQYMDYYVTIPLDNEVCNLRVFSQQELTLLETWLALRTSKMNLVHLNTLARELGSDHCDDLLPPFTIDKEKNTLRCSDKESLDKVIGRTKQLIRWFNEEVNQFTTAQVADVPTAVESIFQGKSQNYLISLPKSQVDFLDSAKLKDFLACPSKRILFIHTKDTEFQVTKLYNVLKQIKEDKNNETDKYLQKYLKDKCQTFLEWTQLQELAERVNIGSILKSDTSFDNLLVIEYKSESDSEVSNSDRMFLDSVFEKLEKPVDKKIIFISSHKIKLPEGITTVHHTDGVNITDLTIQAQKTLLEKSISLQGTEISLAELIGIQNLDNASSIATFNSLIDSDQLKQFITATSIVLDVGKELPTLSDLEVAYTTPLNKVTSLQQLRMHFSNLDQSVSRRTYFVISGVSEDRRASEPGWREILEAGNNKVEIKWIPKYLEDGELLFKELIHKFPGNVVNWLHSSAGQLRWQQIYDPGFYIQRHFIKRLIIDNTKISKAKNTNNLFVLHYSKDKDTLMQSLKITNEKDFFKNFNIISSDDQDDAIIKNNFGKNIHFFMVEERDDGCNIVWRRSVGSLDGLRPYMMYDEKEAMEEKQLCDGSSKLVILADEPGMGKSTSLTSVSGLIESSWVIRIDFKHFQQPISKLPYDVTICDAVQFLLTESIGGDGFEQKLLQYCLQTKSSRQVYVLFDGFDEIQEIHKTGEIIKKCAQEKVVRLLKFLKDNTEANILVTTRKYPSHILENELSVFATKFKKVDVEQQKAFVVGFWHCHLALEPATAREQDDVLQKCVTSWYSQAKLTLGENIASFMGIPLQMRMMAEVSLAQVRLCLESFDHRDIALPFSTVFDLYEIFIDAKYDIYLKDKSGFSAGLNKVNRGWFKCKLTKMHRTLAFRQLFPDLATRFLGPELTDEDIVELNRVGLIQSGGDGTIEFTHRTFAEFFTAELLVYWLGKPRGRHPKYPSTEEILLFRVLLVADYKVCRQFIDDQLRRASSALWNNQSQVRHLWSDKKKQFFDTAHQTALHVAVQEKRDSILSYLLGSFEENTSVEDYISFVTAHDLSGDTVLALAAKNESNIIVEKLLTHVNNDIQKKIILSTVFKSFKNRNDLCPQIDFLINFTLRTKGCWKLERSFVQKIGQLIKSVISAANSGKLQDLQTALDNAETFADLHYFLAAADHKGATALHIAAKSGQFDIVEYLLQKHAEVDALDCDAMTPLLHAAVAKTSNIKVVKYLISHGANFMHCDRYNMTALAWAAKSGHLDIVQYLYDLKANLLNISDINWITPFQHAAKGGHREVVEFLFKKGVDIDGQDRFGMSALSWAARQKNTLPVMKFLLEKKTDINQKDRYGRSSLQIAIKASNWEEAKYLVEKGAEINSADWNGVTALQRATRAGKWDLVQQMNSELLKKTSANKTHLDYDIITV